MNEIQIMSNPQFGDLRYVMIDGNPWWVLKDVCTALGLSNPTVVSGRLDEDERAKFSLGRQGDATVINESGLYAAILRSDKKKAKPFRKWVTSEVLPSIRKTGQYTVGQELAKPDSYMIEDPIDRAKRWIEEAQERKALAMENHELSNTNEMLSQKNEEQRMTITAMEPKVRFADAVVGTDKAIMVGELAAILAQNGFSIGQNRLFEWLRRNHFLVKSGTRYNQPTSYSMKLGLFEVLERVIYLPNGKTDLKFTPKVTPKGQKFFVRLFLSGKANYR